MKTRFLTWNIGSFYFLKFGSFFGFKSHDAFEYYQPKKNNKLISNFIKSIDPDFIYLQEFYNPTDEHSIEYLKEYPYRVFLDMWYRKKGALIASKKPFQHKQVDGINHIYYEELTILPIHFNSFSPNLRHKEAKEVINISSKVKNTVIFGDTNIWSKARKFLFSMDRQTYSDLTSSFVDYSQDCISTSFFGFGLDKVLSSKEVTINNINSPKVRGQFMDHYPVYFDVLHRLDL